MRIFISHSSLDKNIARALIELLQKALSPLNDADIRCTSVDGYEFPLSENPDDRIKVEILESELVLALVTPNALKSYYFLFELGARWAINKPLIPIVSSDAEIKEIAPLFTVNFSRPQMNFAQGHRLLENTKNLLGVNLNNSSVYTYKVKEFLKLLNGSSEFQEQLPFSTNELALLNEIKKSRSGESQEVFIKKLSHKLNLDKQTTNEVIDKLLNKGMVDYFSNSKYYIGLTKQGENLISNTSK